MKSINLKLYKITAITYINIILDSPGSVIRERVKTKGYIAAEKEETYQLKWLELISSIMKEVIKWTSQKFSSIPKYNNKKKIEWRLSHSQEQAKILNTIEKSKRNV